MEVDKHELSGLKIFSFLNFYKVYLILLRKILWPPSFSEDRIQLKFYLYLLSLNWDNYSELFISSCFNWLECHKALKTFSEMVHFFLFYNFSR